MKRRFYLWLVLALQLGVWPVLGMGQGVTPLSVGASGQAAKKAMGGLSSTAQARPSATPSIPKWFNQELKHGDGTVCTVRAGNAVTPLVDGEETFRAMANAIRTADGSTTNHFIYIAGWWLDYDFPLDGANGSTLKTLLDQANKQGVEIRALLYDQKRRLTTRNLSQVFGINQLKHGTAIYDQHVLWNGAHHQKILLVNGKQGLLAFCGGLDINPDRLWAKGVSYNKEGDTEGAPLHDVHCRIAGPAARDILNTFVERWEDHPERTGTFNLPGRLQNSFKVLVKALPHIKKLIILIPNSDITELKVPLGHNEATFRRHAFIAPLIQAGGDKVVVCVLKGKEKESPHTYVHAKCWIFDDQFTIIGSANCNRRSYSNDSEIVAGIYGGDVAGSLRKKLWAEHLGLSSAGGEQLGLSAGYHAWADPPSGAHIAAYDWKTVVFDPTHSIGNTLFGPLLVGGNWWDKLIDPDGGPVDP